MIFYSTHSFTASSRLISCPFFRTSQRALAVCSSVIESSSLSLSDDEPVLGSGTRLLHRVLMCLEAQRGLQCNIDDMFAFDVTHVLVKSLTLCSIPRRSLTFLPMANMESPLEESPSHMPILSPLGRTLTTAPLTSSECSSKASPVVNNFVNNIPFNGLRLPIKQSMTSNQKLSKQLNLAFLSKLISHRPPLRFLSSSHIGFTPS